MLWVMSVRAPLGPIPIFGCFGISVKEIVASPEVARKRKGAGESVAFDEAPGGGFS